MEMIVGAYTYLILTILICIIIEKLKGSKPAWAILIATIETQAFLQAIFPYCWKFAAYDWYLLYSGIDIGW